MYPYITPLLNDSQDIRKMTIKLNTTQSLFRLWSASLLLRHNEFTYIQLGIASNEKEQIIFLIKKTENDCQTIENIVSNK